ncbi:MAG: UDP-3-O-(3-hydroxymyristoyl)glucosamine N-acyltransferase [Saprospiraceae bacterium]|nr:UDP-3-O-(3-hydroxymyristoyl)glucosamine N-acyltransferase [Saprospiraceae bacterium]
MKLDPPIAVKDIANEINARLLGNENLMATGINEIHKVQIGDITFVDHPKYYERSLNSAASIIIIDKEVDPPEGKCLLICDNPFKAYDGLVCKYRPFKAIDSRISSDVVIPDSTIVEPGVTISNNVSIGENCYLQAGVYIGEYSVIGNNVSIGPGTIIGSDAFYFKKEEGKYTKWRSGGRVVLEDDVDVGANCTINKGVSGDTRIGQGSKLDCLVHIGHGAVIGENCLLAGQVGIGGKTILGDNCVLYGQVGIAQSLKIGNNVTILAKSGVSKDLEGDNVYFGTPAEKARNKYRELAALRMLPDHLKKHK